MPNQKTSQPDRLTEIRENLLKKIEKLRNEKDLPVEEMDEILNELEEFVEMATG